MSTSWISFFFFFVAALIHFAFFVFEFFVLHKPHVYQSLGYTDDQMKALKPWIKNQGLYNLALALGVFVGFSFIFQKKIMMAGTLVSFCGATMLVAGIYLYFTEKRLRKWALIQMLPPAMGFVFLVLHVLERIQGG